jgi:hypothetical protein
MYVIKIENIYDQHEPILVQCDDYAVDGDMVMCYAWDVSTHFTQPIFVYMLCHGDTVEVLDREEDVCDIPVHVVH